MATADSGGLFSDVVFTATELNRRVGAVLDQARKGPVTISRNNEQFALLRREEAAKWVRTVSRTNAALALLSEAHAAMSGEPPSASFTWLSVYDKEDLQRLVSELLGAVRSATLGLAEWDETEAVMHEWRESALVAQTGFLDSVMDQDAGDEEAPLPHPNEVAEAEGADSGCQRS